MYRRKIKPLLNFQAQNFFGKYSWKCHSVFVCQLPFGALTPKNTAEQKYPSKFSSSEHRWCRNPKITISCHITMGGCSQPLHSILSFWLWGKLVQSLAALYPHPYSVILWHTERFALPLPSAGVLLVFSQFLPTRLLGAWQDSDPGEPTLPRQQKVFRKCSECPCSCISCRGAWGHI